MDLARWTGAVVLVLAACGAGDGGGDDDGGIEEATPILDLAPRIARACSVVSSTTMIGDGLESGFSVIAANDRYFALTARNDQMVTMSELDLEPIALRAPTWSANTWLAYTYPGAAESDGGRLAIAWSELRVDPNIEYRYAVAFLDGSGAQMGVTRYFSTDDEVSVGIVARPGGFALTVTDRSRVQLVLLDLDGAPLGSPVTIATGVGVGGHLVRHGEGFAFAWLDRAGDVSRVRAVLLDASGTSRSDVRELSAGLEGWTWGAFVLSVGSEVLIAWEELHSPPVPGDEGGYSIVRVARMTDDGAVVRPILRVQAPEVGVVTPNPTLAFVDGRVTLSFGRGDFIAICGGCITNYKMNFVQLDPVDLAPVSNVVEVSGPAGLRSAPVASLDGRDFAYLLAIDRHARFDLAAAMVRCEPSP